MRAMILAAGMGTRLRPLTDRVPKPLIEVAGRPMIAFALKLLREAGIEEVVINLHHLGDQVRHVLGDGRDHGVQLKYSEENPILDTGGGIAAAREFLQTGTFAVLNADTFVDMKLQAMIAFHREHGGLATLLLRPDRDAVRRDDIGIDGRGRIRRFLGQDAAAPATASGAVPLMRCMYAGIMLFEPAIFEYLPVGIYSITKHVLPRVLADGMALYGYLHSGYWRVLDTPADLEAGRREIPGLLQAGGEFY